MKTKVDIFSGFLGAGKTTLIKKLLDESFYTENVVVIENEFGKVPIDGSFLKKTNIKIKEINAGCICCTIAGDFKKAIQEVHDKYEPERIIIEPSGVGKLSEILGAINSLELKNVVDLNIVITIVDVTKFNLYLTNFGEFYKDQIKSAKCIVLSRTELWSFEKIEAVVEQIRKLNAVCSIVTTPVEQLSADKILKAVEEDFNEELLAQTVKLRRANSNIIVKTSSSGYIHNADEVFDSFGIETPLVFNKSELLNILNKLNDEDIVGTVLRAKGIVQVEHNNWIEFDYVPNELDIRDTTADYTGKICIIGCKLNKDYINKLFDV